MVMDVGARRLDAWCDMCQDVRSCRMQDPGSCACTVCGQVILLMKPLGSPDSLPEPAVAKR